MLSVICICSEKPIFCLLLKKRHEVALCTSRRGLSAQSNDSQFYSKYSYSSRAADVEVQLNGLLIAIKNKMIIVRHINKRLDELEVGFPNRLRDSPFIFMV